jgi:hypothetical protein
MNCAAILVVLFTTLIEQIQTEAEKSLAHDVADGVPAHDLSGGQGRH